MNINLFCLASNNNKMHQMNPYNAQNVYFPEYLVSSSRWIHYLMTLSNDSQRQPK